MDLMTENEMPEKLFYCIDASCGWVKLCRVRPKAKPVKRPQKVLDREKYIDETKEKLAALSAEHYELRRSFIENVHVTSRGAEALLRGAVSACVLQVLSYVHTDSNQITALFDAKDLPYEKRIPAVTDKLLVGDKEHFAKVIYAAFGDRKDAVYHTGYRYEFPKHQKNAPLDALYAWLGLLGYEMSTEEKQVQDGTHPLFVDKDGEKNA